MLAHADWLRGHPSEANIEAAVDADPINSQGYMLRAERLELANRPGVARVAWRDAASRDERNPAAWIQLGLSSESQGDANDAERCFLRAADVSRTWLPRWNLVNFYLRHNRPGDARQWARLAFERASDDVPGLFAALETAGVEVEPLLPNNRPVLAAYIIHRLRSRPPPHKAGLALLKLIPESAVAWPGAESPLSFIRRTHCTKAERTALVGIVNALLDSRDGATAVQFWNTLHANGILAADRWSTGRPVINTRFATPPAGGLDWLALHTDHAEAAIGPNELAVHLDGRQPECVDLVSQRLYLPRGRSYRLVIESSTRDLDTHNGLEWQVRLLDCDIAARAPVPAAENWIRSVAGLASWSDDRTANLVLTCRRQPTAMRAEGTARFRFVSLQAIE